MSSRVFVPFDNNPVSTTKKSGSYTVPQGKYAEVIPHSADLTINGVSIGISQTAGISASNPGSNTGTSTYLITFPPGTLLTNISVTVSNTITTGTIALYIGNSTYTALASITRTTTGTSSSSLSIPIGSSVNSLYASSASVNARTISGNITYMSLQNSQKFWVPSGTVLSGNNYVIEEYNAIS